MENKELEFVVNSLGEVKPISKIPTRQLLSLYHGMLSGYYWSEEDWSDYLVRKQQMKAELAAREHIPNRKESKVIRQRNAKKLHSSRNKNK